MTDSYPEPVSDPAGAGLPDYADDDSTAYDEVASPRQADGPDPAPLPPDRDAGPLVLDDFGTTAEEQRQGESLDLRLAREEPDVTPNSVPVEPEPGLAGEADDETSAGQVAEDSAVLVDEPVNPNLDSRVSMYDRDEPGIPSLAQLGRLVAPDEGAHPDTETDQIAVDDGAAGGGASAEELAMHPVPPDELP